MTSRAASAIGDKVNGGPITDFLVLKVIEVAALGCLQQVRLLLHVDDHLGGSVQIACGVNWRQGQQLSLSC